MNFVPKCMDNTFWNIPEEMSWGFPQYQKKGLLINASAETALERKSFRDSVMHRRCIIPAKQFYEWDSDKNKVTFLRENQPVLFMAGFYDRFQDEDHFIILTTQANESVSPVHHRMPLILEKSKYLFNENVFFDILLAYNP
ncbi:SOS response-associated peptidase [Sporofaciens sp. SGI.106]|uniref:SOS response-associated peptidase n=1 Tax=Sporofaciens sp. SGI.106 TaxID=3420568 RepID=UPI002A9C5B3A|nr:SOS response-associated peptidase family protein [Lachnoclostridium sp.]